MKVSEIMPPAAVADRADDTLAEAARKMWEQQTGSLLVMDGDSLLGIITERGLLHVRDVQDEDQRGQEAQRGRDLLLDTGLLLHSLDALARPVDRDEVRND